MTVERPAGMSIWEEQLYDHLTGHIESEGAILDEYGDLAAGSTGHVRYLLELIAADEARHHHLYEEWARTIRNLTLTGEIGDGIPNVRPEDDPGSVVQAVSRLLAIEEADEKELRQLRKSLEDFESTTLWPLLVDLMRLDTEKHIRILNYLRQHARRTQKGR